MGGNTNEEMDTYLFVRGNTNEEMDTYLGQKIYINWKSWNKFSVNKSIFAWVFLNQCQKKQAKQNEVTIIFSTSLLLSTFEHLDLQNKLQEAVLILSKGVLASNDLKL